MKAALLEKRCNFENGHLASLPLRRRQSLRESSRAVRLRKLLRRKRLKGLHNQHCTSARTPWTPELNYKITTCLKTLWLQRSGCPFPCASTLPIISRVEDQVVDQWVQLPQKTKVQFQKIKIVTFRILDENTKSYV